MATKRKRVKNNLFFSAFSLNFFDPSFFHHAGDLSDPCRVSAALVKTCRVGGDNLPSEQELSPEFHQNEQVFFQTTATHVSLAGCPPRGLVAKH